MTYLQINEMEYFTDDKLPKQIKHNSVNGKNLFYYVRNHFGALKFIYIYNVCI